MTQGPIHLLYATHDGQTRRIAEKMACVWKQRGTPFFLHDLSEKAPDPALWPLEAIPVVLSPIRYGFHLPEVDSFLRKNKKILEKQRLVLVSVNLTARKPNKNEPHNNPYFKKWVRQHGLPPALGAVLAGRLEYRLYPAWEKWIIRFIMFLTNGPTHFNAVVDYTPWDKVDALAAQIASLAGKERRAA